MRVHSSRLRRWLGASRASSDPHCVGSESWPSITWSALTAAALGAMLAGCGPSYESEVAGQGYTVEVVANGVRNTDGLARHPSGAILATEEYRGGGVVRIDPVSGEFSHIVRNLADPDNILVIDGEIYLTEEDVEGRIARIDQSERLTTFVSGLNRPEGLDVGPDGSLYVTEHWPTGSVYRYLPDGTRTTLGSVENGEGLRVLPDGSVVVAETSLHLVSRFFPDGTKTTVIEGSLTSPDGLTYEPTSDRLLVTEDEAPGRLLSVDYETGMFEVLATGLNKPQTMLLEADGAILLSEQGENRVLRFRRITP